MHFTKYRYCDQIKVDENAFQTHSVQALTIDLNSAHTNIESAKDE